MEKQVKSPAAPRLRFPEFRGAKAWTTIELRQLSEFVTERVGTTDCTPYTVSSGVGLVSQQEKLGRTIAGNSLKNYIVLQKNDFAYNKSATKAFPQGFIARYVGEDRAAVPNSIFTCFRTNDDLIDSTYLDNLFSTNLHGNWLRNRIAVGARAHGSLNVSDEDLMDLPVPLPGGSSSLTEQQKIADCLTSLDEVIAAQGRKVDALKAHKRGLMQRLFPREGETRPRLRFPEFRNAPEWSEGALGSLTIKVGSGVTPRGGDKNYKTKGRPFMRSQNVGWGQLLLDDIVFIDESTHASFDGTEIAESDVLLNITGASIGRSAIADHKIAGGNVNQHVCIIRTKQDALDPVLLNQFLISERGQEQIDSFQAGGNRQGLNFAQIRSFQIPLPPTRGEQQRIADCLSSLDTQITTEANQLATLKAHKQGLMQQLFPAPEAAGA